jgi:hypothetical protein
VVAVELVAEPPAGGLRIDRVTGKHRADRFSADRDGAAHPGLALLGIAGDERAVERLHVIEQPVGEHLDSALGILRAHDFSVDAVHPVAEERRVTDVVGAQERVDRDAAPDELACVVNRGGRGHALGGRTAKPDHVGRQP